MNHLPDELLGSIFKYAINDVSQLLTLQLVCKKFHRLSNNAYLWYYAYKTMYPSWSFNVNYAHQKQPLIDWKYLMLKQYKQKTFIKSNNFQLESILSKKSPVPPNFKLQEPFVSDIDPITNTGVVAVSKYCKYTRHKILFYHYPSYELIRKFQFQFQISDVFEWSCQIIKIQTLVINNEKIRLFAVSLNQPRVMVDSDDEEDQPQRDELQNLWKAIIIYRLHDDGTTTCLAHLETSSLFLGRGSYFFNSIGSGVEETKKWLQIISPDSVDDYDPTNSVFMLAYGLSLRHFAGYSQIIHLDLRANETFLDPSKTVYAWDDEEDKFVIAKRFNKARIISPSLPPSRMTTTTGLYSSPESTTSSISSSNYRDTTFSAKVISTFYLGARVSCMIHIRYPPQLNHLIITGNFHRNELSIYDWRFELKVGVFMHNRQGRQDVEIWGLETGWAIPPPHPPLAGEDDQNILLYGPRLIVVGDGQDKFEIKVWDISQLLKVKWDPFSDDALEEENGMTEEEENESEAPAMVHLDWWNRRTMRLKQVALNGYLNKVEALPYTMPQDAIKKVHLLDAQVKYTAYINLQTWSYLLREDGNLSVMDIESGEILKTVNTNGIAEDVNVVGEKEIIITRKDEMLRSLLP